MSPKPGDVTLTKFRGVSPTPVEACELPWDEFVTELEALVATQVRPPKDDSGKAHADAKKRCPGFVLGTIDGTRRKETVGPLTALAVDIDRVPGNDLDAFLARCERLRCAVYETPSSTEDAPRLRVIAAQARPILPEHVPAARRALAAELGLDPAVCGTDEAIDASRLMFYGGFRGTPARGFWAFEGAVWVPPKRKPEKKPARKKPQERCRSATAPTSAEPVQGTFDFDAVPDLSTIAKHVPPAGVDADRHKLVRGLGGWLARRGYRPECIAEAVRLQIPAADPDERALQAQDAAERFLAGLEAPGWDALTEWCAVWGRKGTLSKLEAALRDPAEPEGFGCPGEPWSAWWAGYWPRFEAQCQRREQAARVRAAVGPELSEELSGGVGYDGPSVDGTGLMLHPLTGWPWILQHKNTYWIHLPSKPGYGPQCVQGELGMWVSRDLRNLVPKEERAMAELQDTMIGKVTRVVLSYTATLTTYSPDATQVTVAALARMPAAQAAFHEGVDAWLRALFGDDYDKGAQWIASCSDLSRAAPCLYLTGELEIGKSLLFAGLARLWGQSNPVEMDETVSGDGFNEMQCECPLVYADEGLPEKMSFTKFRSMVTGHTRRVNRKGISKVGVDGYARIAIGANGESVLRWAKTGELSRNDQDAIAERLLHVRCGTRAEVAPALAGQPTAEWADRMIAEHALWLAKTVPLVPDGRMCVTPSGGAELVQAVVQDRYAPVATAIVEALAGGRVAHEKAHVWRSTRDDRVIFVHVEQLFAYMRQDDTKLRIGDVREACKAFARLGSVAEHRKPPGSDLKVGTYSLDVDGVGAAAGVRLP